MFYEYEDFFLLLLWFWQTELIIKYFSFSKLKFFYCYEYIFMYVFHI